MKTHRADWDELVGVVHHGDEEVEQDDDVDDGEGAEHDQAPEPRELLDPRQLKVVEVDEAKGRPKQGLAGFPKAENGRIWNWIFAEILLGKFSVGKAVIDLNDDLVIFLHLKLEICSLLFST